MAESVSLTPEHPIRPHMPELDTLRGIAVSLVVCFHAFGFRYGVTGLSGVPRVLVALTMSGWVGVNLFFVLSGFLITGILLDTKSRSDYYRRFYLRRALRILPLYYAVLLLLLVLARSGLVPRHVSWSFLALSGVYLANMASLFGVPMQYGVLWSLAVEEHFYLLWPAVVRRLSRRRIMICATLVAATCLMLRMFYSLRGFEAGGYTWLSADGLAMGAALAVVARGASGSRARIRSFTLCAFAVSLALFVAGAPLGILLARYFLGRTLRETALDLFCVAILGFTLLLGTSRWRSLVNIRPFQFLGQISYGIYLTHMLIFEVVVSAMTRYHLVGDAKGHFAIMLLQFCIAGLATIALTWLSRWYFEEPFLRLKDRAPRTRDGLSSRTEQLVA